MPFSILIAIEDWATPGVDTPAEVSPDAPATVAVPDETPAPGATSGLGAYGVLPAINVNPVLIFVITSGDIIVPFFR